MFLNEQTRNWQSWLNMDTIFYRILVDLNQETGFRVDRGRIYSEKHRDFFEKNIIEYLQNPDYNYFGIDLRDIRTNVSFNASVNSIFLNVADAARARRKYVENEALLWWNTYHNLFEIFLCDFLQKNMDKYKKQYGFVFYCTMDNVNFFLLSEKPELTLGYTYAAITLQRDDPHTKLYRPALRSFYHYMYENIDFIDITSWSNKKIFQYHRNRVKSKLGIYISLLNQLDKFK